MKVLVVDADPILSDVIGYTLWRAGFETLTAFDGKTALQRIHEDNPALVLLDIELPDSDGLTLCKLIDEMGTTPVIILSERGSDEDIVNGLSSGADDYIIKPFSPAQLIARVRAVVRRAGLAMGSRLLTFEDVVLDLERREIRRTASLSGPQLTELECRLLEALILNSGRVLPYNMLVNIIWGSDGAERTALKQLVYRLRQKLTQISLRPISLENVQGVGYTLVRIQ